jgi:hypothetical protein
MSWNIKQGDRTYIAPDYGVITVENKAPAEAQKGRDKILAGWREKTLRDLAGKPSIDKYRRLQAQLTQAESAHAGGPARVQELQGKRAALLENPGDDFIAAIRAIDGQLAQINSDLEADGALTTLRNLTEDARQAVLEDIATVSQKHGYTMRGELAELKGKMLADLLAKNESALNSLSAVDLALLRLDNLAQPVCGLDVVMAASK